MSRADVSRWHTRNLWQPAQILVRAQAAVGLTFLAPAARRGRLTNLQQTQQARIFQVDDKISARGLMVRGPSGI
jgi:hypothetical protein